MTQVPDRLEPSRRSVQAGNAIEVRGLSKRFSMSRGGRRTSVKERLVRGSSARPEDFWALRDATFDVPRGSMFGIIGHNGSGKSTALKVLTGIYRPTSGSVRVNGRVSALLELGAGFHPELTGRENITLNASILGLSPQRIDEVTDDIIEFADIGDFIDTPIKVYSSGMHVRLGFAIAVNVNPEILIIDEVIAVGDESFKRKCYDYLHDLRRRGTTIVIVTHSMGIIRDWCDLAMWLDHGEMRALGPGPEVVEAYLRSVNDSEARSGKRPAPRSDGSGPEPASPTRHGSGEVQIRSAELRSGDSPVDVLVTGESGTVRLHYRAGEDVPEAVFGLKFVTEQGVVVSGPNSGVAGAVAVPRGSGYVDYDMTPVLLAPGSYSLDVAVVHGGHVFDYVTACATVRIRDDGLSQGGVVRLPGTWSPVHPVNETAETRSAATIEQD